ncbi:flagellar hook-length control protein FliK [Arsukibacterium sp.]|uniref:flagellar hook-length control protein FliK n=1 Tax=Arsukibacterium sp. TaxID=1977258 RepID=UPI00356364C7
MNPLLSLSFSSSGPAGGTEPASQQLGAAMDEIGASDNFGRLLNQSGEQQQLNDGQNFAALQITGKSKRAVSMEGRAAGRPEQTLPPVIPPEAELSLADDSQAGTLLGLLDLASQTRLQLKLHANNNAQFAAHAAGTDVTKAGSVGAAATEGAGDEAIIMADLADIADKKGLKAKWFILPVFPESAATDAASSNKAERVENNKISDGNSDGADSSANSKSSDSSDEGTTAQSQIVSDKATQLELKTALPASSSETASVGQVQTKPGADAALNLAALGQDPQSDSTIGSRGAALAVASEKSDGKAAAVKDTNMLNTANAAATSATKNEAANADVAKIKVVNTNSEAFTADERATAAVTEQSRGAQSDEQQIKADMAMKADPHKPDVATATSGEDSAAKALTASKTAAQGISPAASATIFENAEKSVLLEDGQPASALANSLASAATVADSAQVRAQQRAGLAENNPSLKQALTENPDLAASQVKTDPGLMAGSARLETANSGFAAGSGQAAQNQSDAAIARLDAATVAIAGAQQSAERAKAQSVNKAVTEQLKQVNLLTQDAAGQLKERINLMVRQNIQVAEIRLDPADLGQMQIRVNLQQEQASVQFIVQQQHAKELLEQQMPRLREMLQQQGIQLGEGQVQQQRQGDSQTGSQRNGSTGTGQQGSEQPVDEQATAVQLDVKLSERIVDYYA